MTPICVACGIRDERGQRGHEGKGQRQKFHKFLILKQVFVV